MDSTQLAADVAKFIAPFLPYLIEGGKIAAKAAFETAGKKFVESAWEKAEGLWDKVNPKVKADPKTESAFERAAQKPEDKREGILEMQFEDMFNEDAGFKQDVEQIIYAGDNSVVVGRDVTGKMWQWVTTRRRRKQSTITPFTVIRLHPLSRLWSN